MTTTPPMTKASTSPPVKRDTPAATPRRATGSEANCSIRMLKPERGLVAGGEAHGVGDEEVDVVAPQRQELLAGVVAGGTAHDVGDVDRAVVEHGDGLVRSEWIARVYGERLARAFEEIKICTGYELDGQPVHYYDLDSYQLGRAKPVYNYMHDLPNLQNQTIPYLPQRLVKRYDGRVHPRFIDRFCRFLRITPDTFREIAAQKGLGEFYMVRYQTPGIAERP